MCCVAPLAGDLVKLYPQVQQFALLLVSDPTIVDNSKRYDLAELDQVPQILRTQGMRDLRVLCHPKYAEAVATFVVSSRQM